MLMSNLAQRKHEIERAAIVIRFTTIIVLFPLFIPNYQS